MIKKYTESGIGFFFSVNKFQKFHIRTGTNIFVKLFCTMPVFKHFKLASLSSSLENVNRKILVMIIICIYLAIII